MGCVTCVGSTRGRRGTWGATPHPTLAASAPPSPPPPPAGASPVQDMPLEAFFAPLQRVAVAKMVRQLSEVYSVMRVSTMSELAPFIGFGQVRRLSKSNTRCVVLHDPVVCCAVCGAPDQQGADSCLRWHPVAAVA